MITRRINTGFPTSASSPQTLVDQMTGALRTAICEGKYAVGETLPTWKELAAVAGTSLRVPREAIARLQEEGLVRSRRRIGAVVLAKNAAGQRGHVVFIQPEGPDVSFYSNVRTSTLSRTIMNAGYQFSRVILPTIRPGIFNLRQLDSLLHQHIDLAILSEDLPGVIHQLTEAKVPFICPEPSQSPYERGVLQKNVGPAVDGFVRDCKAAGVRRVVQVGFRTEPHSALKALRSAGIAASEVIFPPDRSQPRLEAVKRAALDGITRRFVTGREPLPDLFYFTDDFVANGAITALLAGGVRLPEDVKIVSYAVRGCLPVYTKTIATLAIDPVADGKAIADRAISLLQKKKTPDVIPLEIVYIRGETLIP